MPLDRLALLVTTLIALVGPFFAVWRDRRRPVLDAAQATNALVNSDAVKIEIKRLSDASNLRRDLRMLDLENWAFDLVRPWGRDCVQKFEQQGQVVRELANAVGREVPEIRLAPFPEMPAPRPL